MYLCHVTNPEIAEIIINTGSIQRVNMESDGGLKCFDFKDKTQYDPGIADKRGVRLLLKWEDTATPEPDIGHSYKEDTLYFNHWRYYIFSIPTRPLLKVKGIIFYNHDELEEYLNISSKPWFVPEKEYESYKRKVKLKYIKKIRKTIRDTPTFLRV